MNDKIARYIELVSELEPLEKEIKSHLLKKMETKGISQLSVNGLVAKLTKAYVRHSFNTTSFKEEHPRLYKNYLKDTEVSASIKLEVK